MVTSVPNYSFLYFNSGKRCKKRDMLLKKMINKNKILSLNLLCVLVYFPVAFLQFVLPLFFVIFKVLNFWLVSVVSIDDITVSCAFVVYYGSALHILIIVVHIDISLWVSYSSRFHVSVHLTCCEKVLYILTGDNSVLKCFIHALSLNKS